MGFLEAITEENVWKVFRVVLGLFMMMALKVCGIFISVKIHQWYTKFFGPFKYQLEMQDKKENDKLLTDESELDDEEEIDTLSAGKRNNQGEGSGVKNVDEDDEENCIAENEIKALFKFMSSNTQTQPKSDDELIKDVDELLSQIRQRKLKKEIANTLQEALSSKKGKGTTTTKSKLV